MREKPGEEWEAGRRIRRERGDGREQEEEKQRQREV